MPTLVGRDKEVRALEALIEGARGERSSVLVLRGEPGIGKSALLEAAAERANGMNVLRCVGIEAEHEFAFASMHQLVRPCFDLIDRLPAPQAAALRGALGMSADGVGDRFLVSLGLLSLLAEYADEEPVLCLIDDAQWIDQPSAEALVFAARRLEAEPVAIVITAREGEAHRFHAADLPELTLEGIAEADAAELLRDRLDRQPSADVLESLLAMAAGNPLALLELPSGLTPGQLDGAEPIVGPPRARGAVEGEFHDRAAALPPAAQRVLLLAAADEIGDVAEIGRAADRLGGSLEDLEPAVEAGLVLINGSIAFRHPLVRSAVYRSASRDERGRAHEALAAAIDDPSRAIWHRAAITDGSDEGLAAELEDSGEQAAARGAQTTAAASFERAAELSGEQAKRAGRLCRAAEASMDAGRTDAALGLVERARPLLDDPVQLAVLEMVRAAEAGRRGSPADAYELIKAAGDAIAEVNPDQARTMVLWSLFTSFQGGWAERIVGEVDSSIRSLGSAGNPTFARYGLELMDAIGAAVAGDAKLAREKFDRVEARDEELADAPMATAPAFVLLIRGDFARMCAVIEGVIAEQRANGVVMGLAGSMAVLAGSQVFDRRLRPAVASIDEGLQLARQFGYENDETGLLALRARVAALQGREDECREDAAAALRRSLANGIGWATLNARLALGELELGLGNTGEAIAQFDQLDRSVLPPIALVTTPDLVDALLRQGDQERAAAAVDAYRAWAPVSCAELVDATVARVSAQVSDYAEEAESLFGEALSRHGPGGSAFERARTQLAYGEWLRRARRKTDARAQLRTALDTFEGIGASLWADRARGELRATGETARKRDVTTVDDLTPQELRIAQLVSGGATNRDAAAQLFVSPKTVEYHLRKVFLKLGVTSRVELAGAQLSEALATPD